jgi:uncharacterized repeat protein (TIGR01451 family)
MNLRNLGATAALCALVACGGGGGGGSATNGTPAPTPSATSSVSVELRLPTDPAPLGEMRWYDLVISNAGPEPATDVRVQSNYSSSFSPDRVTCQSAGGAICPSVPEGMSVPSLPVHGSLRYRVFARQGSRGALTISSSVIASNDTADRASHHAQIDLHAYLADIQVAAVAPAGELTAGAKATYTMTVTNAGPDAASEVAIHNLVDANQALNGIRCTAGGGARCPSSVGPAMSAPWIPMGGSLQFTVDTLPWPTTVGPITNKLQVSALGDPNIYNNSAIATARLAIPSNPGTLVQLESDATDFIGQGQTHVYDRANSYLQVGVSGSQLTVRVIGDEDWQGSFQLPGTLSRLQPGTYLNLGKTEASPVGGLDWTGEGRGCNSLTGWIIVDRVTYSGSTPTLVDLRFEQRCESAVAGLRGRIRWVASDTTQPPDPITPPPGNLWRAAAGATPAQGSYVYLRREPYNPVSGSAASQLFTRSDSVMSVASNGRGLEIRVNGDAVWSVDFRAPNHMTELKPGYYRGLAQQENPARGFLFSSLQACDKPLGWLAIDNVTYAAGVLSSIDLRFEQHCYNDVSAFRGQVRWIAGETTQPPGPQATPPGLWAPPANSTPSAGNYVYLESDEGDYIGQGLTRLFIAANFAINVTSAGIQRHARVIVGDDMNWRGEFDAMTSVPRLVPGFYFGVGGSPFHNPAKGGLAWSGDFRGCNALWGWFVVDSVSYSGDELTSLDARFEQHCEFADAALRGKVHWVK